MGTMLQPGRGTQSRQGRQEARAKRSSEQTEVWGQSAAQAGAKNSALGELKEFGLDWTAEGGDGRT